MIRLSHHAQTRAQQRGITLSMIQSILGNADVEKPVGDDCTLIRISKREACAIDDGEKLSRFAVIWSDRNAQIVTVLPLHRTSKSRRYRSRH